MSLFSDFVKGVDNLMGEVTHEIHKGDPNYRRMVRDLQDSVGPMAIIGLVTGCAAVVFGLIALTTLSVGAAVLTGLTVCVSYNTMQIAANVAEISKFPAKFYSGYGSGSGLNKTSLKTALCKGTFGCAWLLNGIVDGLDILKKESSIRKRK